MKLVIDISEDVYTRLFDNGIQDNEIAVDDICEMARSLRRGTPLDEVLDKIRAEIKAMFPPSGSWMYEEGHEVEHTVCEVLVDVLQIIDKYTKGEGE